MHRPGKLGLYSEDLEIYIFLCNTKPVSMRIEYYGFIVVEADRVFVREHYRSKLS